MHDYPCFRFSHDDLEDLRDRGEDQWVIDGYCEWLQLLPELDPLIAQLEQAFVGVKLGSGTGLLEAQGLDDYASRKELQVLRSRDEKIDWRRIAAGSLNECYSAPTFMDVDGFVFHLPRYLIAELNDELRTGFVDSYLLCSPPEPKGWIERLDALQKEVLIAVLRLIGQHPNYLYLNDCKRVKRMIERILDA